MSRRARLAGEGNMTLVCSNGDGTDRVICQFGSHSEATSSKKIADKVNPNSFINQDSYARSILGELAFFGIKFSTL